MPMQPTSKSSEKASRTVRDTLNLRIRPDLRSLIDQAAELAGKSRTDFVLEASRRAAEETLLDRTLWLADPDAFATFSERLDAPSAPSERLRHVLARKAPWDQP